MFSNSTTMECAVCMDADITHVCVPCGHIALCGTCAESMLAADAPCPLCRAAVSSVMRVYLPSAATPAAPSGAPTPPILVPSLARVPPAPMPPQHLPAAVPVPVPVPLLPSCEKRTSIEVVMTIPYGLKALVRTDTRRATCRWSLTPQTWNFVVWPDETLQLSVHMDNSSDDQAAEACIRLRHMPRGQWGESASRRQHTYFLVAGGEIRVRASGLV